MTPMSFILLHFSSKTKIMSRERLERAVGEETAGNILEDISLAVGSIERLDQVDGGLVHYVFRVTSESQTAYLKIRGNHYSEIPDIPTQPELIGNEKKAIELLAINSAEYFPEIILYSSVLHYLLLSDIMPGGTTLDKRYQQGRVSSDDLHQLGLAIGSIHSANTSLREPVRNPNDSQYQSNLMKYVLESYGHPILMKASLEHQRRITQLLVGDLSPKNTYIEGDKVRFCDLENAHQGALAYDQAFILAHILLHNVERNTAIAAMWTFLDGYNESGIQVDQGDSLVSDTLHGILLYRLDNPIIRYDLLFKKRRRRQMAENVFWCLNQGSKDFEIIASNLFKK